MARDDPKWTRGAFISSLPKRCLKCHRTGVIYDHREIVRETQGGQSVIMCMVAFCMNGDCHAAFAQRDEGDESRDLTGYKTGRADVTFVNSLPYHISLGGRVSEILSEDDFVKPGTPLCADGAWTGLIYTPTGFRPVPIQPF